MSAALAIAGVSAALRAILTGGLTDHQVGDALGTVPTVLLAAPGAPRSGSAADAPALCLYLYRVAENGALRNAGAVRGGDDVRGRHNPPLALDLHYLITTSGTRELHAEVLLGSALLTLHASPVLRPDVIRAALPNARTTSGLVLQADSPKITLTTPPLDELTRLWTALQTPLRASVTCQVSAVFMESTTGGPVRPIG